MPAPHLTRRQLLRSAALGLGALAVTGPAGASALRSLGATAASTAAEPLRLARVVVRSLEDAAVLAGFDDTHAVFGDGSVEVLLWPGDLARLERTGLPFRITLDDVVAAEQAELRTAAPSSEPVQPGERDGYRRLADFEADLAALAAAHPGRARLLRLPLETLEGRTVLALEIAEDVEAVDGRPTFYMDGLHHAREWPSGELTIMLAYDLLESDEARLAEIRRSVRTLLVPVVNPDGFSWSRDALVDTTNNTAALPLIVTGLEAYWRKNRRSLTGVTAPVADRNPDAYGVDPNRNYGYLWGGPGTSEAPVLQDHCGSAPFSEPEAANVRELALSRHITMMLTHHTYGDMVLRAWGDTRDEPREEALLKGIADGFAAINGYRSMKGIDLYPTTGVTDDWHYAATAGIGFCFEHGRSFHAPYAATVPAMYEKNREAFLQAAELAADTALHGVVTARAVDGDGRGLPARLHVDKDFTTPVARGNPLEESQRTSVTAQDGALELHVNPSTRPVVESAETFRITVAVDGHEPVQRELSVARGQRVDVGVVRFSEATRSGSAPVDLDEQPGAGVGRFRNQRR